MPEHEKYYFFLSPEQIKSAIDSGIELNKVQNKQEEIIPFLDGMQTQDLEASRRLKQGKKPFAPESELAGKLLAEQIEIVKEHFEADENKPVMVSCTPDIADSIARQTLVD